MWLLKVFYVTHLRDRSRSGQFLNMGLNVNLHTYLIVHDVLLHFTLPLTFLIPYSPLHLTSYTDEGMEHAAAFYSTIMKFSVFILRTIIFKKIKKDKL